ncbi:unnamed protein product [Timema podura]|uniref:Uncharacterized protein n=1 Tax=Timema podura TaxID=61482 RepID=A0ABN7NWI5_TIMPD|nr:unnamed protein product [Timema podura]
MSWALAALRLNNSPRCNGVNNAILRKLPLEVINFLVELTNAILLLKLREMQQYVCLESDTTRCDQLNSSFFWLAWRPLSLMFSRASENLPFLSLDNAKQQWSVFNTVVQLSEVSDFIIGLRGRRTFSAITVYKKT